MNFPEWIGDFGQLGYLTLNGNGFRSLPEWILNLEQIYTLELAHNQLTDLPPSVTKLADTLRYLYLNGNPIPVERRAAIQAMLPNTTISW